MGKFRSIETLSIDSTVLCCNFVNTVSTWKTAKNYDYFAVYDNFIAWCYKLEISPRERLESLKELANEQPEQALIALHRIKEIRKVIQGLISAVAQDDNDKKSAYLPAANLLIVDAISRQRLLYVDGKFTMSQIDSANDLLSPVWKAVQSLSELLTDHETKRIKECPMCGWVFLDETKNASRKWCSIKACGTTDKMNRYNQKKSLKLKKDKG